MEICKCPCGKVPERLILETGNSSKWGWVSGSCCGDWAVEFRCFRGDIDNDESRANALEAWNAANRES